MKYKIEYQFRWVMVLCMLVLIYLGNLILIKLPFITINFPKREVGADLLGFFNNVLPRFSYEFHVYNVQTIIVWFCGVLLGSRLGLITLCIYIFIGLVGFPVFAGGGGIDYYKEPTFGYLLSLPINAFLSGWFYEQNKRFFAIFVPIFVTHLSGIIYLLFFKQEWLNISWHLSFSMISYDLIFAFLLTPLMPLVLFFFREMFIQEILVRDSLIGTGNVEHKSQSKRYYL